MENNSFKYSLKYTYLQNNEVKNKIFITICMKIIVFLNHFLGDFQRLRQEREREINNIS